MIHTLTAVTSPASIQRGRLKHSWLENEVLNKTPEIVVTLRREVGWPELQRFPNDATQALALADDVEFGFSPARLVDECAPLAALPKDQRAIIRREVHAAYLKCFDARGASDSLRDAVTRMKAAIAALLDEWHKPDGSISDGELQARWRAVLNEAEHLRSALEALPKGIVLP